MGTSEFLAVIAPNDCGLATTRANLIQEARACESHVFVLERGSRKGSAYTAAPVNRECPCPA